VQAWSVAFTELEIDEEGDLRDAVARLQLLFVRKRIIAKREGLA